MIIPFLRIEQDSTNKDIWCISCIPRLKPGYEFLIICDSKSEAQDVVLHISNENLFYPTVNPKNFIEVTSNFPLLEGLTKVFKWNGKIN